MKLADFRSKIREARRGYEWRVSLGLWVGLGAGMIYLKNVPVQVLAPILGALLFGHAWYWVRWNWVANERDIRLAYYYAETAQLFLLDDGPTPDKRELTKSEKRFGFLRHGPPLFQVGATALLSIAWLIVTWESAH